MAYKHFPVLGDPVDGGRLSLPKGGDAEFREVLSGFRRQALHATQLGLVHPASGMAMSWQAGVPDDMARLIAVLREDAGKHAGD